MQHLFSTGFLKEKAILLFLYFLGAIILSPYHVHYIHLADTLQYMVLAQDYAAGNFYEAINSYWSPLFSWLIALLLRPGLDIFISVQLLQVFLGTITLIGFFSLAPFNEQSRMPFVIFHFSFSILILSFALLFATPDLLFLSLAVWYLVLISQKNFYGRNYFFILFFSFVGSLLYFSKATGFVFFLLSFSLCSALFFLREKKDKALIVKKYFLTLFLFFIFCSPWIFLISKKENKVAISSAAEYNFNLIGPLANEEVMGEIHHPFEWHGLIPPLQEHSLSAWEEPQKMKGAAWSPFDSQEYFFHYLKVIGRNLLSIRSYYFGLDAGIILIIGLLFMYLYKRKEIRTVLLGDTISLVIAVSCTIPYVFVLIMDRYVWINNLVIGMLAAALFGTLVKTNKKAATIFLCSFAFFLVLGPIKELLTFHNDYTSIFEEQQTLYQKIKGNTASLLPESETAGENYTKSSLTCFLSNSKYYGMIRVHDQGIKIASQLSANRINYLLSWTGPINIADSLYSDTVVFRRSGLIVYKLKTINDK